MTYTEPEQQTIRKGFMGAVALVSKADPGFFATFKESFAASKSLMSAPAEVQELLKGGLVAPPKASNPAELDQALFDDLSSAMTILERDPATKQAFGHAVLQACEDVAAASKGVAPEEQAVIDRVRAIVSA